MKPYYQDSAVTIYHGDCREIVPTLGRFDLLLTDPPYGIAGVWKGGFGHGWGKAREDSTMRNEWDAEAPDIAWLLDVARVSIVWGGNHFNLPLSRSWLVWNKPERGFSLSEAELAWTNRDNVVRVFDYKRSDTGRQHPTQKPLALMTWCISLAKDAQTILDPFAGSCTTGRAAKDLGRKAVLIEREERYCEIGAKRMSQEVFDF
jgi:site-specific DNA-methyltransferase (adenine-specific)